MSKSRKNLTGEKFGMLSVLHDAPVPKHVAQALGNKGVRNRYVQCKCDCGRKTSVRVDHLRSGKTRSCGCLPREMRFAQQLDNLIGDDLGLQAWEKSNTLAEIQERSAALEAAARATAAAMRPVNPGPPASQTERAHGLPAGAYAQMMTRQGGVCAICQQPPGVKPLCVDHDHDTGQVRGLLCTPCNHALGFFRDDLGNLARAMKYLVEPPHTLQ